MHESKRPLWRAGGKSNSEGDENKESTNGAMGASNGEIVETEGEVAIRWAGCRANMAKPNICYREKQYKSEYWYKIRAQARFSRQEGVP